ncbi:multidrug resistance-associated protein 1 [Biomphalaria glabrata]|nr:multidrug resistance-associated protein 1 [Biomphalaria glabrata]
MYATDVLRFIWMVSVMFLVVVQLVLNCFSDVQLSTYNRYVSENECPEVNASFLSKLTFSWITRLIFTGYRRPLNPSDLWQLNPRDLSDTVVARFSRAWFKYNKVKRFDQQSSWRATNGTSSNSSSNEQTNGNRNKNNGHYERSSSSGEKSPLIKRSQSKKSDEYQDLNQILPVNRRSKCNLFRVIVRAFGWEVLLSYLCKAISDLLQFVGPFLLRGLILHIQGLEDHPKWHGYVLATAMLLASWLQTVFYHQHYHLAMTSGMRMKTALQVAIYKKGLWIDNYGQRSCTTGEVVNLMSVDCQRVQDMMSYTWMVWSIPLQVFLAVYFLWNTLGLPVLAGLGLLVLLVPLNAFIAYKQQKLQRQNLFWKDKRVKMVNEVLGGIKVLKLYAWEESFQKKILALRQREVCVLTKLAWLNAISIFIWTCAPYLVCLASFATYLAVYPTSALTADMAFVTLALFNILQFPISFIPEMVSFTTQAIVSVSRIERYLCETELTRSHYDKLDGKDCAVSIDKGVFTWDADLPFRLSGINIEIPRGSFVAVVGPVGCGKSSLLSAILGEMDRLQGNVYTSGNIGYVPQTAWIQNSTLQENILFGASMNFKRYNKVIDSCALRPDLDILPGGDKTEIGEKGINLSGGQKQRVSIARALYSNADLYILDDPLSAVDAYVGKHIFKRVLSEKGILKHKTRIMATHAVHWLPLVDTIIVLQDGRITEMGSYLQLMKRNGNFAQFLLTNLRRAQDSESEIEEDVEVRDMKKKMWEHVEVVTSQSEGNTSGEDVINFHQTRLEMMAGGSGTHATTSTEEKRPPLRLVSVVAGGGVGNGAVVRLTEDEAMETGTVKFGVFKTYIQNVGTFATLVIFVMFALFQLSSVLGNVWLSKWTGDQQIESGNITATQLMEKNRMYLSVYGALGAAQALFVLIYACVGALRMVTAASTMHSAMLDRVLKAPMSFFDTTPVGRIVNRFSRDVETLDNQLPQIIFMWIMCVFSVLATLVVISVNTPLFAGVIVPLLLAYLAIQRFFVPTSRQLKRLEAVTRSPIYSHFSETLSGAHVIRAFDAVSRFCQTCVEKIDRNQVFYFAGITANRWLGVWIEVVSSLIVFFSAIFSLVTPGVNGAILGLSVSYALQITQALKWLVRSMSDLETNVVSVERVKEYSHVVQEAPRSTNIHPPPEWPTRGEIIVNQYTTSYRQGLEPVLKRITCYIKPEEKIGIVGRTGAGKSSLTLALFRLLEPTEGEIIIDNINTSIIGLTDLRSALTILPQDPVLLSGTLRMNVDPNNEYLDQEIWSALTMSHLKDAVSVMPQGLESEVGENGNNFSAGQRQLICLARALLRRSRILIMDEPTSSVDVETDELVLKTVQKAFKHSTTIIIAHRINTILDCDRVMVIEAGQIVEFDDPQTLLNQENSHFYQLAKSSEKL